MKKNCPELVVAEAAAIFEICGRLYNDRLPPCYQKVDGLYLFAGTSSSEDEVIKAAVSYYLDGRVKLVATSGFDEKCGYVGAHVVKQKLIVSGVEEKDIVLVPVDRDSMLNTLSESEALCEWVKNQKLRVVMIAAPDFHLPRCFMSLLGVMLRTGYNFKLRFLPVEFYRNQSLVHSQGKLSLLSADLFAHELRKIKKYQQKGDLPSFEKVINYLDWRDNVWYRHFYYLSPAWRTRDP